MFFSLSSAIIIGFEDPLYRVNESESGATMICVNVTNPPLDQPLSVNQFFLTATALSGGSASTCSPHS